MFLDETLNTIGSLYEYDSQFTCLDSNIIVCGNLASNPVAAAVFSVLCGDLVLFRCFPCALVPCLLMWDI